MPPSVTRLKAFTISELVVVLLLTSIITGLAYGVLNLVQGQMKGIESNYERNTELNLLRRSLWVDFSTYNHVFYEDKSGRLVFENELKTKTYWFEADRIVGERDTFEIKLRRKEFFLEAKPQHSGEVDAVALQSSELLGGQRIFVFKKNLAVNHLNR